ncbi:MAG: hypothetical protein LBI33_12330 [Propionibacteriaceae bacterium]|jgi:hypothetical protein|nr:hypothetical protein [Propionibacteriaceae bacterium]
MGLFDWFKDDPGPKAPELPAAPTAQDITAALDTMDAKTASSAVSPAVTARVRRITQRLRETLPRMSNAGLTSADQYALIATATSYLPQTVGSYVRLPRDWADSRPVDAGRSSLLVLIDQLDLLAETVDKIYDAVLAKDAEALVVHGRFLAEKFAPGRGPLVPAPAKPAAPASTLDLG